jgi:ABC-2 type transport system permease protein
MKKYLHVMAIGVQNTLTYRVNYLFRATFGFIPIMATIYLWRAVYAGKSAGPDVGTYSLAAMTSYYILVTVVDSLTAVTDDDWQIAADIKDGKISQFLLKPINFLAYRLSLFAAGRMVYTAMAVVPTAILIYCLRQYWVAPPSWTVLAVSVLSLALTGLLQFFISYTMALLAFWVMEVSTFIFIAFAFEYIAGGHLFPLNILPDFWQKALMFTPFPYMLYYPVSVYLGQSAGRQMWLGLAIQAGWVAVAYGLARFVWSRGVKKYSAAGG